MARTDDFIAELEQEAETTSRVLERVPEDALSWRPHEKSMSLGQLALHIAGLPSGFAELLDEPTVEMPEMGSRPEAASVEELLETLEESVEAAARTIGAWGHEALASDWRMTRDGETVVDVPRAGMLRAGLLNHWYHHRGQLTVYLRLLDVPLPAVYGPTADEDVVAER